MMDWQSQVGQAYEGIVPNYIRFGAVGPEEVDKEEPELPPDDVFIIISPQNIVGFSIVPLLDEMVTAAKGRPVLLINPNLEDVSSSEGIMSVRGRSERLAFAGSFSTIYSYRTLYPSPSVYFPIVGAVVKAGPREPFVTFERQEESCGTSGECWEGSSDAMDGRYVDDPGTFMQNPNGGMVRERHVPRGSFDEDPSDPISLELLRKAGAKW